MCTVCFAWLLSTGCRGSRKPTAGLDRNQQYYCGPGVGFYVLQCGYTISQDNGESVLFCSSATKLRSWYATPADPRFRTYARAVHRKRNDASKSRNSAVGFEDHLDLRELCRKRRDEDLNHAFMTHAFCQAVAVWSTRATHVRARTRPHHITISFAHL